VIRGSGYSGQLGLKATSSSAPSLVPYFFENQQPLIKVICGSHHNAVLTREKDIYTWGSNQNGCLGHEINEDFVSFTSNPGLIIGFGTKPRGLPQAIALGKDYTIVCTSRYEGSTMK